MGDNTTTPHEAATPSSVVTKFSSGPTNRLKHVQERRQDVQGGGAAPRGIQQERLHQVQRPLLRQRFHRVLHPRLALLENSPIDIFSYWFIFVAGTLVATWLLAFAYKNTKHILKDKIAVKREAAATKEMPRNWLMTKRSARRK